ncbi:hypothetical protein, conserved [Trypanosoma brucei gambiense DAL972]|uniref:Nodulin-like domain-containing protein n=1 Tax=Trypanosoma brucei gambiense (strain MHOM/CI/86/DAL972) TaxID=679716 RepID=D0A7B1_TRYB9|nr:hypothetical protein, conserved [Trypanosoma brucei gambiense DAL972]CBH17562.1 hypothetical protein, conserved [Trypanosoma brucei gambiense DAL972]|eukprot:XP_011779826.1 hypothetical protein, conserved [Trypanosoma brucei gambiense DAL972]
MHLEQAGERTYALGCTLERRWFLQFFVSILICLNNGACFCFGIFTPFMKGGAFMFNQSQVNVLSTIGVIFSYFSLPTGFLYDAKGPKVTLMVGTVLNVVGWLGMMLIFLKPEDPLMGTSLWVMSLFYAISQFSASFYETGSLLTNLDAFICYQGRVILVQKTFMGLGSSLIVQIYIAFFEIHFDGIWPFFLFLVLYSFTVGVLGTLFVRLPTEKTQCLGLSIPDKGVVASGGGESSLFNVPFNVGTGILFVAIMYTFIVTMVENYREISVSDRHIIGITTIILCVSFLFMILATPSYSNNVGGYHSRSANSSWSSHLVDEMTTTVPGQNNCNSQRAPTEAVDNETARRCDVNAPDAEGIGRGRGVSKDDTNGLNEREPTEPQNGDNLLNPNEEGRRAAERSNHERTVNNSEVVAELQGIKLNGDSLLTNILRREMWVMWYSCLAAWSSATLVSTNSTQIYKALNFDNYSSTVNVAYVSIYGVASAVGRVIVGSIHPMLVSRKIPISIFLCGAPVLNIIGLPLFIFIPKSALFLPFFIIGLATGVSWGSTILVIKSLFAPTSCGKHYAVLFTAGIVSPIIFNVGLFGPIYDHYSKKQGLWDVRECVGTVCVWIPLVVCAIVNVLALPLAVYFFLRIKKRGGFIY